MSVPRMVAAMLERNAISMLICTAPCSPGYANGCAQFANVNPCHV